MRIPVTCMGCSKERILTGSQTGPRWFSGDVLDDGSIIGTCNDGHSNVIALQVPKFDLLFECAGYAFLDGYYRECVIGIATGIERFFEFYLRVACRKMGTADGFEDSWKPISNQSERQRGAFAFVYLLHTGKAVDLKKHDHGTWKELRNNATHKGYVPTREEALAYGNRALAELHGWMRELSDACAEDFSQETARGVHAVAAKHPTINIVTNVTHTIVGTHFPRDWGKHSFEEGLNRMVEIREWVAEEGGQVNG
jgi:hypothetical protein